MLSICVGSKGCWTSHITISGEMVTLALLEVLNKERYDAVLTADQSVDCICRSAACRSLAKVSKLLVLEALILCSTVCSWLLVGLKRLTEPQQ